MVNMVKTIYVTEEQLQKEKEMQDVVDLYESGGISLENGNEKMEGMMNCGLFDQVDIACYIQRRDPPESKYGTRSHIKFALTLKDSHHNEKKTLEHFITLLEIRGHEVAYETLGSDDKGNIMIANFWDRFDTPNRPDYRVKWNGKWKNVEVKNFKHEIWLKVDNLKKYREWKSYILIRFKDSYYLFSNKTSAYLLDKKPYEPKIVCGKPSIIITGDGVNAHFSLKNLIKIGAVKQV